MVLRCFANIRWRTPSSCRGELVGLERARRAGARGGRGVRTSTTPTRTVFVTIGCVAGPSPHHHHDVSRLTHPTLRDGLVGSYSTTKKKKKKKRNEQQ